MYVIIYDILRPMYIVSMFVYFICFGGVENNDTNSFIICLIQTKYEKIYTNRNMLFRSIIIIFFFLLGFQL